MTWEQEVHQEFERFLGESSPYTISKTTKVVLKDHQYIKAVVKHETGAECNMLMFRGPRTAKELAGLLHERLQIWEQEERPLDVSDEWRVAVEKGLKEALQGIAPVRGIWTMRKWKEKWKVGITPEEKECAAFQNKLFDVCHMSAEDAVDCISAEVRRFVPATLLKEVT